MHTRYEGYVDEVFADFEGKRVRAGEPLASIYSPDVLATQEEYLLAYRASKEAEARDGEAPAYTRELLEASRRRLLLWQISPHDIETIEREGTPIRALNLYAPISGVVTARIAFHGMKVMPADALFDLVDLSRVWVVADVYEQDVSRVAEGTPATITLSHAPGRSWIGHVSYVYPTVEENTRTVKVRVEADNADGALRPGMFADVVLSGGARDAITIPDEAVLDSGLRKIVFVHTGEGRFEPREVTTGTRAGGRYEIVRGLAEGESVAVSANFLLDSESRLRAAISAATPRRRTRPLRRAATPMTGAMIKAIIRYSAENRYLVLAIYAILIVYAVITVRKIPLDAIPDLSDTQVIVYSRWDRSPDILEDQVTYPIVAALLGAPRVKAIRGFSDFGFSFVYVIFEDGTDIYWARSRACSST